MLISGNSLDISDILYYNYSDILRSDNLKTKKAEFSSDFFKNQIKKFFTGIYFHKFDQK